MIPEDLIELIQTDPYAHMLYAQWSKMGEDFRDLSVVLDFAVKLCVVLSEKAKSAEELSTYVLNNSIIHYVK